MSRAVYFLALLGAACLAAPAALAADFFTKIDPSPTSELWIDTGFYTAHFDGDKDLNDNNKGLALEYRFKGTMTATAGTIARRSMTLKVERFAMPRFLSAPAHAIKPFLTT